LPIIPKLVVLENANTDFSQSRLLNTTPLR
jgi:hypothetical protein